MNNVISIPHIGKYYITIRCIIKNITKCEILIPILNEISKEYNGPILYLRFDVENNNANIDTKIEDFYEMKT